MNAMLTGKIFVTGGTGTLAQAVLQTAMRERWDTEFTLYSRNEFRQAKIKARFPQVRTILGDVRDYERLSTAIAGHDIVLHLAAMKRIPECEAQPDECIATNVVGSQHVVRACLLHGVKRCVGTSTDKACGGIVLYGASKKIMEGLFQVHSTDDTTFALVRYGNVVASSGSVIPLWQQQARQGAEITVTDKRCTRFWMSPGDAVRLLLQAVSTPAGSILVPKMGALSLLDMLEIAVPGCRSTEIGLRSYEKLHEDLVHPDEPAHDLGGYYLLGKGTTGHTYTSDVAPRLSAESFLRMLAEAEQYA